MSFEPTKPTKPIIDIKLPISCKTSHRLSETAMSMVSAPIDGLFALCDAIADTKYLKYIILSPFILGFLIIYSIPGIGFGACFIGSLIAIFMGYGKVNSIDLVISHPEFFITGIIIGVIIQWSIWAYIKGYIKFSCKTI